MAEEGGGRPERGTGPDVPEASGSRPAPGAQSPDGRLPSEADPLAWAQAAAPEEVRTLLAFAARAYAAARRAGSDGVRLGRFEGGLTPTEVMIAVSDLLRCADVETFELGMWESWGLP